MNWNTWQDDLNTALTASNKCLNKLKFKLISRFKQPTKKQWPNTTIMCWILKKATSSGIPTMFWWHFITHGEKELTDKTANSFLWPTSGTLATVLFTDFQKSFQLVSIFKISMLPIIQKRLGLIDYWTSYFWKDAPMVIRSKSNDRILEK